MVVAGMEGALPSVVGGLVDCPVIAVPTSIGYGPIFSGLAALLGMLNSCASNVVVVNIDAGFNGGHVAGLIARRAGLARALQSSATGPAQHPEPRWPALKSRHAESKPSTDTVGEPDRYTGGECHGTERITSLPG